MEPIIRSLLDNDLYKFSMQNAVLKLFPKEKVKYEFMLRSSVSFPKNFAENLKSAVNNMQYLTLTSEEKTFFSFKCNYIDPSYFDFLSGYRYNPAEVDIVQTDKELKIKVKGLWYRTILWEVPLLAIVSELYFKMTPHFMYDDNIRHDNNKNKAVMFNESSLKVADFGTRRRYSYEIQKEMINDLQTKMTKGLFVGTSNVHFAHFFNLTPVGTEAHEWFMFHGAKYGFQCANELGLKHWADIYNGSLGTALCDTFTTDAFLKSFNMKYAKLYDGVRQDSGDPIKFAEKMIAHYQKLGIDPLSKTIVFSDSLDPEKAKEINNWCIGKIKCSFGIGTNLSNDVGVMPLNMVIKMTAVKLEEDDKWIPTIKLSDVSGKHTGDPKMIEVCKYLLNIE